MADLSFRIVNLVSEGVYLDENCVTNPSRHIPGLKMAIKNRKKSDFGVLGDSGGKFYIQTPDLPP